MVLEERLKAAEDIADEVNLKARDKRDKRAEAFFLLVYA